MFFLAKDETSPRQECKYAVETEVDQTQINNFQHFPLFLDCQNNQYEVGILENSTFKPIPYSSWIKNNKQQKPLKQKMYRTKLFPLRDKFIRTSKYRFKIHNKLSFSPP